MSPGRAFGAVAGSVAFALALASCGERLIGTGVVLWSDGGPAATGATVDVVEESTIEDRYLVRAAGADRGAEAAPMGPRWRVRLFADAEQAAEFAARFADYVNVYAYAVRRGLPVRAEASSTAGIVYKLREQEVVKVIERGAEPERVGSFENYWYSVLTADGTEGYTYGEFLPVFSSVGDPHAEAARLHADDPGLERVLGTAWRPEEFLSMMLRRRFDLLRLRPEYGLFPDPVARVFRLVSAQREREFRYHEVERVGDGRYLLATEGGDGSAARFTLRGNGVLAFSYVDEGRQITELFVELEEEVGDLIAAEQARRERLFAALLEHGPLLRSGGYGTIELTGEGRFRWQGYEALVPRWIPDGLPGTGVVDFRYALAAPLRGGYDVAVTLLFDRPEPATAEMAAGSAAGAGATAADAGTLAAAGGAGQAAGAVTVNGEAGGAATGTGAGGTAAGAAEAAGVVTVGGEAGGAATGDTADGAEGAGAAGTADGEAGSGTAATPGTAATGKDGPAEPDAGEAIEGAAEREPEYMRPVAWAAELTVLLSYDGDGDGVRLTPAEPAAAALEVRQVNRSAVVMYFASASAGDD